MIFNEDVLYKDRLNTDFESSEAQKPDVILLKDIHVVEMRITSNTEQENIAQRKIRGLLLLQSGGLAELSNHHKETLLHYK